MSIEKSPRHIAALAFAEQGIPVFPCVVDGKAPATPNGFHDATTDTATIDAWWSEADYNVAFSPEDYGWCVVDPDSGEGKHGPENWEALQAEFGRAPETYTVTTPRGGKHYYFEGSLPGTQGSINGMADDVDTRGRGSYVLVPPSTVEGKPYVVLSNNDVAPVPAWVVERTRGRHTAAPSATHEVDQPADVMRARVLLADYVRRGDVAVEGRGGDTRTFILCCELLNLGLSADAALGLVEEIWNPVCRPPWSREELEVKFQNAASYAQNEPGAWASTPAATTFSAALDKLPAEPVQPQERSRFHAEDEAEQETGADPSWLIPNLLPEASTSLMVGPSGSYKSFLALDMALALATGTETFGSLPLSAGLTFYAAAEGRANVKKARRRAWKLARGIEAVPDFYVMPAPIIALPEDMQQFGDEIARRCGSRKPKLIVLDTLAKCMAGLNENDAADAGKFIRFCDSLVEAFGATVLALHHTGKDDSRGARGSSAFLAGFDTVLEAKAHRATKAVEVWVRKHKDAEEPERPWTLEGKVVGQSLVFQPTTAEEHRTLTGDTNELDPRKVGAALQRLNAFGQENAVTSHVLAGELVPQELGVEERQSLQNKTARSLGALARSKLEAYCARLGRDLAWFLPAPSA